MLRDILWELKQIIQNENVRMTLIIATLMYAILYPLPYQNQLPRDLPIAIIDQDHSSSSRQLIRMIDATPQVAIINSSPSEIDAKRQLQKGEVNGYIVIPKGFNTDMLRQKSCTLSYVGDGAYYLVYGQIAKGLMAATNGFNDELKHKLLVTALPDGQIDFVNTSIDNAYNTQLGYRNYVIPGVFLLLLHQLTLVGMISINWQARNREHYDGRFTIASHISRYFAFLLVMVPIALIYYKGFLPLYAIDVRTSFGVLIAFFMVFYAAVYLMSIPISRWITHTQWAVVISLFTSIPLVFSAGFIWPKESLPEIWNLLVSWVPAIWGTDWLFQLM